MRRAPAEVRKIEPDPIYQSILVSQIINKVLWKGKKGAARRIVYGALDIVERDELHGSLGAERQIVDKGRAGFLGRRDKENKSLRRHSTGRRAGGHLGKLQPRLVFIRRTAPDRDQRREAEGGAWLDGAGR